MAFIIDGSTGIATVDGSVSAPSQRGQDSNSGISYGADTIKFSTGGVERMSITNSGITGITAGITHASSWYLTSGFTGSADPVTNLSTYTSAYAGTLGSAMTISSGVFTFPTTGIWWIAVDVGFNIDGDSRYNRVQIKTTNDNMSNSSAAQASYCFMDDSGFSGAAYQGMHTNHLFDVQDTSTHKCRIGVETVNSSVNVWFMKVLFVRYGDT